MKREHIERWLAGDRLEALQRSFPAAGLSVARLPGETLSRRTSDSYARAAAVRATRVDFARLPALRTLVQAELEQRSDVNFGLLLALKHLENAANATLPRAVREEHVDIAGRRVWDSERRGAGLTSFGAAFMRAYTELGGI